MRLESVKIKLYRNFVEPQDISIEPDVTCLVGKNESGKTTILRALHRLKPANGDNTAFDLTTEYPRWRLAADRRADPALGETVPIEATFALDDSDRTVLTNLYDVPIPDDACVIAWRDYDNKHGVELSCTVAAAATTAADTVGLPADELAGLPIERALGELVTAARARAKHHRDLGETALAKFLTSFATEVGGYSTLIDSEVATSEQVEGLWKRVPKFFYFSNYDTLPGETDLTDLATKVAAGTRLSARERAVVALLAHAGEKPSDFLDEDYDSRKAELQSASIDLSRRVFQYWRQNPDLAVVFDTDNRVVATQPNGVPIVKRYLKIELRDSRHGDVETNFDTRSTGFQWFFSFFAAFSEYQTSSANIIVLLDEPGTSLHGDAQREFVEYIFNELGSSKQTLYTTHSQHMVDPTQYEKLRAVHDRATRENPDSGVVVTLPNLAADAATILPIESALGYSVSQHLFLGSGQHLVVEGSSDYVYLQRLTEHLVSRGEPGLDPRLAVIPVGGVDNMPAFVALLGRRLKVSALIDGARSSNRLARIRAAGKDNGVPESAIVLCSDVPGLPTNADIEDLFAVEDYLRLYNWAFDARVTSSDLAPTSEPILKRLAAHLGRDFDHALPAHVLTRRRDEFFAAAKDSTSVNFGELFKLLNATVSS